MGLPLTSEVIDRYGSISHVLNDDRYAKGLQRMDHRQLLLKDQVHSLFLQPNVGSGRVSKLMAICMTEVVEQEV